ncbi:MAG: hypothetical protein K2M65_00285, partial [Muribaculaceae bacterium]|nr:hypothetical protein [Muribaculaceae bacterium]
IYSNVEYFQWTFTTDNMAVIYIAIPAHGDTFWLIDRLTTTELYVNQASQDPVLFPGTHQNYEKYSAEPKQR